LLGDKTPSNVFPSSKQWKKWSLPSKLTAIGAYLGVAGIILSTALYFVSDSQPNQRQRDPILDAKLLLRIGGFRINILNSGAAPATGTYVDIVAWRPGAPGADVEKTIPIRDLATHADFTFDVSFRNPLLEPDYKDTLPTCGYIAVSCIGASRPRAWAFYIPNADGEETRRKFFKVDPWPMIEFQYPEDKPGIGYCVDFPRGVCGSSDWLWSPKDITVHHK
jgi:hypothetical protein